MKNQLLHTIQDWLSIIGFNDEFSGIIAVIIILSAIALLSWAANYIAKNILLVIVRKIIRKSKSRWDDIFYEKKVFHKLSHFVPAIIIYYTIGFAFPESPGTVGFFNQLVFIYILFICLLVIYAFLNVLNEIYFIAIGKDRGTSIKSYIQGVKIIFTIIFVLVILSILLNREIGYFLTALGAMSAILILVFRDSILGLVGGIQLTSNDMVRIGDWIEMPSRNADGTVFEVSLNTVKVRNFDMTISTIPTYALVSESFTNWRGMEESGGRRIMRNIFIDQKSIRFIDRELFDKLSKFKLLKPYLEQRSKEIEEYNRKHNLPEEDNIVNGRKLTNVGVFRKYIELYLKNNDKINKNMIFLIRHLSPSEKGLPIQVYVFSKIKAWVDYEGVQADIFDHLLAILPEFELSIFQNPTGEDILQAISRLEFKN